MEGTRREGIREREEVNRNADEGGGVKVFSKLTQTVYVVCNM